MSKINSEYVKPKELAKIIRMPLRKRWGAENVKVTCATGTAYGWIDARIEVPRPTDCFCKPREPYCGNCASRLHETSEEARKIVRNAMTDAGASFSTYYGDQDNEPREEFILQVSIKRNDSNN